MADFDLARRDLGAFSAMLIGRPLAEWQLRALTFTTFATCLIAGRQMGKSLCAVVAASPRPESAARAPLPTRLGCR